MKKYNQGLSSLTLIISVVVIAGVLGGVYLYKNSTNTKTNSSYIPSVVIQDTNVTSKSVTNTDTKAVSQNSNSNFCGNFTESDIKEIAGNIKYSPSYITGDGGYTCSYTNGRTSPGLAITVITVNPSGYFSSLYDAINNNTMPASMPSKIITDVGDKAFSVIINVSGLATLNVLKGNTVFYVNYVSNNSAEQNLEMEKKIAEKFISKL